MIKILVSILVLMDLAHEYNAELCMEPFLRVSILVLMDLAHEYINMLIMLLRYPVSILVLMDLAHEFVPLPEFPLNPMFQSLF